MLANETRNNLYPLSHPRRSKLMYGPVLGHCTPSGHTPAFESTEMPSLESQVDFPYAARASK